MNDPNEQLREAIRRSGLTHLELAHRAGVSQGGVTMFMNNQRSASLTHAAKLAAVIGMQIKIVPNKTRGK